MNARLQDIADRVGVRCSTVSVVLNNRRGTVRVSEKTRQSILQTAKELDYHPNLSARAMKTKRTGHVGFVLSDRVTGGFANMYFAQHLVGIEQVCRARGYGVNVSLYNLSNIDSFVFPPRVGERSVDGLILAGYVQADVVTRFREFGIPCICIGDNLEVAELIPTISCDIVGGLHQAIAHAASLGHRRIGFCEEPDRRGREVAQLLAQRVAGDPATSHCQLRVIQLPEARNDYSDARPLAEWLVSQPAGVRPTALLATDQTLVALLGELARHGLRCPRDLSLISNCDTVLCEFCVPQLTAVNLDVAALGAIAAELLLNHLDQGALLDGSVSRNDAPCKLVIRNSCSSAA